MSDRSTWFRGLRRDYIRWRLDSVGEISRGDIVRTFQMSMQQASLDLGDEEIMTYDSKRKRYVPVAKLSRPERARLDRIAAALNWS